MNDLYKANSSQLYFLWRNFAIGLLTLIALLLANKIFPVFLAPVFSTLCAGVLYFMVYRNTYSETQSCMLTPYALFICMVSYTIVLVGLNLANIWTVFSLPAEFVFFARPFAPSLIFAPVALIVCVVLYLRRSRIGMCVDCKIRNGTPIQRGRTGAILNSESTMQIKNLIKLFGLITIIAWGYYLWFFIDFGFTKRDSYVFTWISTIIILLDVVFYAMRYYNLYLDLKERDEIVSPQELDDIQSKTYLRFYVFCDDYVYLSVNSHDKMRDDNFEIMDTPFFTKTNFSAGLPDVKREIVEMTGVKDGELKFFYGRKSPDLVHHKILRYFYFLPGVPEDYPELSTKGVWISSDKVKKVLRKAPYQFSTLFLADSNRLNTIIITEKTYKDNGERKWQLKQYTPSFNFKELRNSNLDFQDDKWIRIASFNSDVRFFRLKKWFRRLNGRYSDNTSSGMNV